MSKAITSEILVSLKSFLVKLLGEQQVIDDPDGLADYSEDSTEIEGQLPGVVALVSSAEQIQQIVRYASEGGIPLTPRVAGTNVGGLTIPSPGGLVIDLTRMNRVLEINDEDMYAIIEPGVTQQGLKEAIRESGYDLATGYSLAPPHTSVLANAVMGGLTNRSLKYGDQASWISGLEVVLGDGSTIRTGSWALSEVPFGRIPFPDLTGLFVGWQGTTGIVTKLAFQLWPAHPLNERLFILAYYVDKTYQAVAALCRTEICDDIGCLSWPSAKMMMGVPNPHPYPSEGDPLFFLYVDLTAETEDEMNAKKNILSSVLSRIDPKGRSFEEPLRIETLVKASPGLSGFAEFPTDLKFLTDHGGGGLSWIGTYGPVSRFAEAATVGMELMASRGVPPVIVSRPMRGGHFGVLRFISTFDKSDSEQVTLIRELNDELLEILTQRGFVMYKTPIWAWQKMEPRIDQGMLDMMRKIKGLMDPTGIFNPGKLCL